MQRIILIITYIITITLSSIAGSTIDVPALFKRLRTTETQELMKLGAYYDTVNEPDSALVCYSIVNDRLSGTHLSEEDQQIYCRALTNLGFLYASYYFDYTKAMMFFQKSNEESRQSGYTSNLAYNYLNMAGVYLSCTQIYRNQLFEEEIWKCSEQGIETALKSEEWEVALASMLNAGLLNMQHPQPEKFGKMVSDIREVKFPTDVNMLNVYLTFMSGAELFSQGNYVKALYEFRHLAEMIDINAMQGARFLITAHTAEAYTLAALGRYSEAIEKTKEYMGEAQRAGLDDEVAKGYLWLSDYYKNIGDQRGESQSLLDYHNKKEGQHQTSVDKP